VPCCFSDMVWNSFHKFLRGQAWVPNQKKNL
jgi:hypothetical protein